MLRLHLRGRHREGHGAYGRRRVRLDRARKALHRDHDGTVPGPPLPAARGPAARARDRDRRSRRRHDHGAAAVAARVTRAARRPRPRAGDADVDPPSPRGTRSDDDVDRRVAAAALLRRPRRRGACGPRFGRRDRRLHSGEAARRGAGGRCVPRAPLPEPLRRPQARARALRGPEHRRRADHGRRDGGSSGGTLSGGSTSRSRTSRVRSQRSTSPGPAHGN